MTSFIAVYRGDTVATAKLIAVSADPGLVSQVATELLNDPQYSPALGNDPVLVALNRGQRRALRLVRGCKQACGD